MAGKKTIGKRHAGKKHDAGHDTRYVKLQKNSCFVCGIDNPEGMKLRFTYDEERNRYICRFRLGKRYTGPPGHCHGGIIATILDEAMGKVNKIRHVIAVTSEMTVNYLKPVPLHRPLRVESREVKVEGRKHINMAEILDEKGEVLARSHGLFIAIDPHRMFAKFAKK
ncbi:MAG: PaaI family thioesterase [Terriglobales bacterium]